MLERGHCECKTPNFRTLVSANCLMNRVYRTASRGGGALPYIWSPRMLPRSGSVFWDFAPLRVGSERPFCTHKGRVFTNFAPLRVAIEKFALNIDFLYQNWEFFSRIQKLAFLRQKSGFKAQNFYMFRDFSYNLAPLRVGLKSCCTPKGGYFALFAPVRVVFFDVFLAPAPVRVRATRGSTRVIFGGEYPPPGNCIFFSYK